MSAEVLINCEPCPSDTEHVAFLWRSDNCFVMDNHRVALWCWLRAIDRSQKYNILHIDRHLDALYWPSSVWTSLSIQRSISEMTIEDYLAARIVGDDEPFTAFTDDNYLSAFVYFCPNYLNTLYIASHSVQFRPDGNTEFTCQAPRWEQTQYIPLDQLPENLGWWFESAPDSRDHKWIVNIDVDYFFYPDCDTASRRLFSSEYVAHLLGGLRKQLGEGRIDVVTIALSPANTGTWNKAREMCLEICAHLEIPLGEAHIRP